MGGTIALGLVGGLLASKLLFRARLRRHRFHRRWRGEVASAPPQLDTARRLDARLAGLELNQRQSDEAREAFGEVAQALGERWLSWNGLEPALEAVGAEPFDAATARAALGALDEQPARVALDALEHVHNILTPEQRDRLRNPEL